MRARNLLTTEQRRKHDKLFFEALRQKNKGNDDAAYDLLTHALEINPNSSEASYEKAKLLFNNTPQLYNKNISTEDSLRLAEADLLALRAHQLEPQNYHYLQQLAQRTYNKQKYVRAAQLYEELLCLHPTAEDKAVLIDIYKAEKNYEAALSLLQQLEASEGRSSYFLRERLNILWEQGKKTQVRQTIDSLYQANTQDLEQSMLCAQAYVNAEAPQQAIKVYENCLTTFPEAYEDLLPLLLVRYKDMDNKEKFLTQLTDYINNPKTNEGKKGELLKLLGSMALLKEFDKQHCYDLIYQAGETHPNSTELIELLPMFAEQAKMQGDTTLTALHRMLRHEPDNERLRITLLAQELKKENIEKVGQLCSEGIKHHPAQALFYHYLGIVKWQNEGENAAAKIWQQGINHADSTTDKEILSDLYTSLADWHHKQKRKAKSYAAFEQALRYNPDNMLCLNNYAYFLSLDKQQLNKALRMSEKTMKSEGDNPTYVDTYAWLLFQLHRYEEARQQIVHCLQISVQDKQESISPTLLLHAAAIYSELNKISIAKQFRKFAQQAMNDNLDVTALQALLDSL